jgi:hypothetical protein
MKKALLFILGIGLNLLLACSNGAQDAKNEVEPYPTYDTNRPVENKNIPPTDSPGGGVEVENPQDRNRQ